MTFSTVKFLIKIATDSPFSAMLIMKKLIYFIFRRVLLKFIIWDLFTGIFKLIDLKLVDLSGL